MISFQNVSVEYRPGEKALDEINLEIEDGEFVVVVGLSGAGKSTLIRSINNLVPITSGELVVDEESVGKLSRSGVRKLRSKIGMIFQGFNLVDRASVIQNVLMGRVYKLSTWRTVFGFYPKKDKQIAAEALNRVGLLEKSHSRATDLSGGQRQRVGIARALSQEPKLPERCHKSPG
jgi:phosphonate transport system ATP-binding protein